MIGAGDERYQLLAVFRSHARIIKRFLLELRNCIVVVFLILRVDKLIEFETVIGLLIDFIVKRGENLILLLLIERVELDYRVLGAKFRLFIFQYAPEHAPVEHVVPVDE